MDGYRIFGSIIQKSEDNYKRDRKKPRTASLNRFSDKNQDDDSISHMIFNDNNNTQMEFLKNIISTEFKNHQLNHRDELIKKLCVRLYTALQNNEEIKKSEMVIAQELQDMKHEMQQFSTLVFNKKQQQQQNIENDKTINGGNISHDSSYIKNNSINKTNDFNDEESSLELCRKQILSQSSFLSQIDYNHIDTIIDDNSNECDRTKKYSNKQQQQSLLNSTALNPDTNVQMLIEQIKTLENKIQTERQNYLEENERLNMVIDEKQKIVDELLAKEQKQQQQQSIQNKSVNNKTCDPIVVDNNNPLQGLFDWRIEDHFGCEFSSNQPQSSNSNLYDVYDNNDNSSNNLYNFQTNNRLLVVLSDLVKTFLDTENDIQKQLEQLGLERAKNGSSPLNKSTNNDDLLAFPSLEEERLLMSTSEITTFDLCEDGPDLTTPSSLMFPPTSTNNTLSVSGSVGGGTNGPTIVGTTNTPNNNDIEDDVVLGASRRLRLAVERVLKILSDTLDHQKNDFKELLKQKEDLSLEFQEECQRSDQLTRQLMEKENLIKNLENDHQKLSEKLLDYNEIKDQHEKLKEKLEEFERERDKFLSDNKRLEMERKSFDQGLPQLHQKIINENENLNRDIRQLQQEKKNLITKINYLTSEVETLKTEKDQIIENKNAEFEELISQLDSKEKNLNSLKRFIEEQTQERESEREEFNKEVASLKDKIKENEKYENKLKSKIRSFESQIALLNDEKSQKDEQLEEMTKNFKEVNSKLSDLNLQKRQLETEIEKNNLIEKDLNDRLKKLSNVLQIKLNDETDWDEVINALDQLIKNKTPSPLLTSTPTTTASYNKTRINKLNNTKLTGAALKPDQDLDNSIFATIKLMDDKMKELNENIDNLQKKNEILQSELNDKNKKIEQLEQLKSKMETMEKNLKELTKTNELLQQEINESHLKYSELKVKLDSSVDIQEFKRVVNDLQNKLNQEKKQSEQLSMKLEQANRYSNELNEKLDAYKKEIKSFKELLKTHDNNNHFSQDNHKLSNNNNAVKDKISLNDGRNSKDFNYELLQLNNKLELKDRTISLLEQNLEILKSKLDSITQERDTFVERIKKMDDSKNKVTMYEKNIEQLRLQNKIQSDKITYLDLEIQNLKKKIDLLEKENELLKLENRKLLKQKQEINAAMIADYVDEPNDLVVNGNGNVYLNGFDKMNHISSNNLLMLKVRRLLTQKGALIYQKNYLIHVLGSYQRTENDTLALLANFNNYKDVDDECAKMRGKSKFRSIVYSLIALNRMKFMVNIWQCRKRQLLFHKTANSIATLQNVPLPPRKIAKDNNNLIKNSVSNHHYSPSHHLNNNNNNDNHTHQLKLNPMNTQINSTLKDYVDRLHVVHETLGLHTNNKKL